MFERLTCIQGHAWEALTATESPCCPECGLPPDPGSFAESESVPAKAPTPLPISDDRGKPVVIGYEILADRGRTPFGVRLYQAKQLVAGREVLLQVVLAREDSGQRAWNALRGEASGHGKLSHPHIVQLYEAGERDRQLFFNAMEFIDGPLLPEVIGDEPLPLEQVVALMEMLARAIAYANDQRQIHRHLEPNAILLQRVPAPRVGPGQAKPGGGVCRLGEGFYIPRIRGFGLARRPVEGDLLDIDLYADAGYLSPEQSWGKGQELGPHTDVYGLGGILYFLLTGRPPYRGPTQEDILDAIQTAPLVKPSEIRRTPAALEFVCRSALARRVSRRYPDATALADDLRRIADHYPPELFRPSLTQRFGSWRKRRPGLAASLLMGGLCVLSTLIAYAVGSREPSPSPRSPVFQDGAMNAENNRLREQLREVTAWQRIQDHHGRILLAALVAGVNSEAARNALDDCAESDREFEWHYLDRLLMREEKTTLPESLDATAFAFHGSDGKAVAVAKSVPNQETATIRVLDLASTRRLFEMTGLPSPIRRMVYLENGRLAVLAGTRPGKLYLFQRDLVMGLQDTISSPTHVGMGNGYNQLLVLNEDCDLRYHDANNARPFGPPRSALGRRFAKPESTRAALLPRGQGVAVVETNKEGVQLWSDNGPIARLPGIDGNVECMASDAEGLLAVATSEKHILFARSNGGSPPVPCQGPKASVKRMTFSPDGKRLAVADADGTILILGLVPPRPEALQVNGKVESDKWAELLKIPVSGVRGLEFGPDGKTLAAASPGGIVVLGAWK